MGLVECLDVGVGFNFFFSFSNSHTFYVCEPLFFQGCIHFLLCCQRKLPASDKPLGSVVFFMWVGPAVGCMEDFDFQYAFCLAPALHLDKQVSSRLFGIALVDNTFSIRKGENFAR